MHQFKYDINYTDTVQMLYELIFSSSSFYFFMILQSLIYLSIFFLSFFSLPFSLSFSLSYSQHILPEIWPHKFA